MGVAMKQLMLRSMAWQAVFGLVWLGCASEAPVDGSDPGESDSMLEDPPVAELQDAIDPADDPDAAYAIVGETATVDALAGLHLRQGPSTSDAIIESIPYGSTIDVLDEANGWYQVTYGNVTGWSYGGYLSPTSFASGPTKRDRALARARSGVGFSYHWGAGCWKPGADHPGVCNGNCPDCTHAGEWGADCSGYVTKIWQIPGATALTTCTHPYSTFTFRYTTLHWHPIARSNVKPGDAFVYNSNGAGHIFLYDSGDPWGWARVFEAKGCSYGIVHDSRTVTSSYIAIRREGYN